MKKLLTIFFVSLLALHYAGYYFTFHVLNKQLEDSWRTQYERNQFEDEHFQEMTIPISFPYLHEQTEYVNVDELMEIDGKIYRILKKKYEKGNLHLVYINDKEKEGVESLFQKWLADMNQNNKSTQNNGNLNHSFDKQYFSQLFDFSLNMTPIFNINHNTPYLDSFRDVYLETLIPPPKQS